MRDVVHWTTSSGQGPDRVARVREREAPIAWRGRPGVVVSDNGAEFTSSAVLTFIPQHAADWRSIAPEKPMHTVFAESFHGRMRDACLNEHLVFSMNDARAVIGGLVHDDETARPHSSLGYLTPPPWSPWCARNAHRRCAP